METTAQRKISSRLIRSLIFMTCFMLCQACASTREPWLGFDFYRNTGPQETGTQLYAFITDVDDIADLWIINNASLEQTFFSSILRAEWQYGEGRAEEDVTRHLDYGVNYLIFTLFNKKYKGVSIYGEGGKFMCDFSLYLDGKKIYRKKLLQNFNDKKLIIASIFKIRLNQDGKIWFDVLTEEEKKKMMDVVHNNLAGVLHETSNDVDLNLNHAIYKSVVQDPDARRILEEFKDLVRGRVP